MVSKFLELENDKKRSAFLQNFDLKKSNKDTLNLNKNWLRITIGSVIIDKTETTVTKGATVLTVCLVVN